MSEEDGTISRKWSRFSVRSIFVAMALVCIYFGLWQATQTVGVTAVLRLEPEGELASPTSSLMPLVVRRYHTAGSSPMPLVVRRYHIYEGPGATTYYLWLLGPIVRLPYEVDWEEAPYPRSGESPNPQDPFGADATHILEKAKGGQGGLLKMF